MENKESHNYNHSHEHMHLSTKNIKITVVLNTLFTIIEFIVGIYSRSIAISSNAIHDLGDSVILMCSLFLENKSKKGRNKKYTYGYRRFSLLGNLINTIVLTAGGILIVYNATGRLFYEEKIDGLAMLIFSIFGIIINGYGAFKLAKDKNTTQKGLFINIVSDFISWIGILFSSILVYFFHIYIFDAIFSLLLGLWLIIEGMKLTKDIFYMLMQAVPKGLDLDKIREIIIHEEGIVDVHDIHIWTLDGEDYISSFHIVTDLKNLEKIMDIKENIKINLEKYGLNHSTIEIDTIDRAYKNGEIDEKYLDLK